MTEMVEGLVEATTVVAAGSVAEGLAMVAGAAAASPSSAAAKHIVSEYAVTVMTAVLHHIEPS